MFVLSIIPTKLLFYCTTPCVGPALLHTQFVRIWDFLSVLVLKNSSSFLLLWFQQTRFTSLIYSSEVQLFEHLVKFHSLEKRDWWCLFKNATNASTKPVLQLSCFTYTTFKHHWNGDILNSCWSLQLGQGFFILFQLTVVTVQNSQSENSQSDDGCCSESLQKKAWRDVKGATNTQRNFSKQMPVRSNSGHFLSQD